MARYRCNRNPDGVRVGQTWYAKSQKGNDADRIKITAVFGKDFIHVTTSQGIKLCTDEQYLKEIYRNSNQNELFGDA